jgi:hypothetical protein
MTSRAPLSPTSIPLYGPNKCQNTLSDRKLRQLFTKIRQHRGGMVGEIARSAPGVNRHAVMVMQWKVSTITKEEDSDREVTVLLSQVHV